MPQIGAGATGERAPWFCSGCPHNTSTKVPEGSRAVAGIGCHYMAVWMDRSTVTFSQMGGEGVSWVGQAPFTTENHIFANLGDGTYYHSGLLAVRQSIAAKVNITYKILFNDAVAMTGGQPVDGTMKVPEMTRELDAEGAMKIVVVTDEPEKYDEHDIAARLAPSVTVHHRDDLDDIQKQLREIPAARSSSTTRPARPRSAAVASAARWKIPTKRVVINELVCEGCGDCSVQSNCLSVEPVETEFGRKRRINQNTCNKDYSCLKGFCPSFVTVEGGKLKSGKKDAPSRPKLSSVATPPEPSLPLAEKPWGIVVAGVGGTGVITIGQLLGMAAHLEGKGIVTQDAAGLAQKGGATWSHIQIANRVRCDLLDQGGHGRGRSRHRLRPDRRRQQGDAGGDARRAAPTSRSTRTRRRPRPSSPTPTGSFPGATARRRSPPLPAPTTWARVDADTLAVQLLGDSIYTNPLMLGYAWQQGRVPLSHAALMRAIELNGVQVDNNKSAFEWGRRAASDPQAVKALVKTGQVIELVKRSTNLDDMIRKRVEFLTDYQNAAYAATYKAFVDRVRACRGRGRVLAHGDAARRRPSRAPSSPRRSPATSSS